MTRNQLIKQKKTALKILIDLFSFLCSKVKMKLSLLLLSAVAQLSYANDVPTRVCPTVS